jgi:hypothetical protein
MVGQKQDRDQQRADERTDEESVSLAAGATHSETALVTHE